MRIARCDLAAAGLLARTNRSGHGYCAMLDGKSLMRSYFSRKFLSGFRSRRIVVCKEENVGTRATRCSSRVFGLVEARRLTNTSFSRLEVACFTRTIQRLEPSRRHDAGFLGKVKGLPWDAQDGALRGRPRKESAPPPVLVGREHSRATILTCQTRLRRRHSETPKETDDTNDADNLPMSETPLNDDRDASHIKSKSSVDTADGVRQRLKFDGEASGMTPDPKRSKETVTTPARFWRWRRRCCHGGRVG